LALASDIVLLAQWRRRVAEMYATVRRGDNHELDWYAFLDARSALLKEHPFTPLGARQRQAFQRLDYYPYDPRLRIFGRLNYEIEPQVLEQDLSEDGRLSMQRIASVHFRLADRPQQLSLFWILGYGGGVFLPFKDTTNGQETYGGGRYLYDTIKGADLGVYYGSILLDFNYAYNPSCAYDARWVCPLAPLENHLQTAVEAGEKKFNTPQ
jgi:uncharacterized protein